MWEEGGERMGGGKRESRWTLRLLGPKSPQDLPEHIVGALEACREKPPQAGSQVQEVEGQRPPTGLSWTQRQAVPGHPPQSLQ